MLQHLKQISSAQELNPIGDLKLFADGASMADFLRLYASGAVSGFTTNPTLMHREKITDYEAFARELLTHIPDMPISFEVFSDEFDEMRRQARKIAAWGDNVYVKVPITNTRRESSLDMVRDLSADGIKLNVTAILTLDQVAGAVDALHAEAPAIISVFAGRIADTGIDPVPVMRATVALASLKPKSEVLWASLREALNIHQAAECGCHIVTATPDILKKMDMAGKDLADLSQETVAMFYKDAMSAGFRL